ncbi:hypothetical protein ACWEVD_09880 [Nocardia thailandica]
MTGTDSGSHPPDDPVGTAQQLITIASELTRLAADLASVARRASGRTQLTEDGGRWSRELDEHIERIYRYRKKVMDIGMRIIADHHASENISPGPATECRGPSTRIRPDDNAGQPG